MWFMFFRSAHFDVKPCSEKPFVTSTDCSTWEVTVPEQNSQQCPLAYDSGGLSDMVATLG